MKSIDKVNEELDAPIPRSAVSVREAGGGRQLSYLKGHYVIDRLNKVFGPLNWASSIVSLEKLFEGQVNGKYYVSYGATVRLVVQVGEGKATEHTETGFGDGMDMHPGKPYELARKEAVTDALKRAAKNLGMSMGLALYDKDQANVVDDEPEQKQKEEAAPAKQEQQGSNRSLVNKRITALSKIAISQGKITLDELKQDMQEKYGSVVKEDISDAHASELASRLEKLVNS